MTTAFDWKGTGPSIFAKSHDHSLKPTHQGITLSQSASLSIKRRVQRTGVNPGTIPGLSPAADRQRITPAERKRRLTP